MISQVKPVKLWGSGVYFHGSGSSRVLVEIVTATSKKSKKFRYKASFSLPPGIFF
jgi:cellobiose-specific phosphotransferase system component IIC